MSHLRKFFVAFDLQSSGKWFLLSGLIGIVAGLGAALFQFLVQFFQRFALADVAGFHPADAAGEPGLEIAGLIFSPWLFILVITLGGLISGILVYTFAPEAEGHGTDAAIDAFHNRRGEIRARVPIIKTITSAITLGTGGSAGREGPIAQIGAGFGSFLARRLKLSSRDTRIMMAAGMGAGIGAIFRAPLAGALFAGEIMYRDVDLESDVIVPTAVASTVAYSIYSMTLPEANRFTPLFGKTLQQIKTSSPLELLPYTLMAVVIAIAGILFIKMFYGTRDLFHKVPIRPHFRPAIGAAMTGCLGVALYYVFRQNTDILAVFGSGYGALQKAFSPISSEDPSANIAIGVLLTVAFFKMITTSLTISSGGSGGVFGPSIVIGGCLGGAIGRIFHIWWPNLCSHPEAYAIVGMAGFFAGSARAPFSTILMVSEITGEYKLLLPTLWVSTMCFLLNRRWTLYEKQVPTRLDSPAHRGDFIVDVLEGIHVKDVLRKGHVPTTIPEGTLLDDIVHLLAKTSQRYFPVVNAQNEMVGIFSADDVRTYLFDDTIWNIANAGDVMQTKVLSVALDDDLNTALRYFTALNIDELPVVASAESPHLVAMLRRKELIGAYNKRLIDLKQGQVE